MGLNLITGPANAGKVALLLRRYLDALPQEPYLIVPNRSDVEERERELLEIQPALLGGSIVTFDDLFKRIARGGSERRQVATEAQIPNLEVFLLAEAGSLRMPEVRKVADRLAAFARQQARYLC